MISEKWRGINAMPVNYNNWVKVIEMTCMSETDNSTNKVTYKKYVERFILS